MQFLFRNRWIAFVWAFSVLGSIAMFVSDDGGSSTLQDSISRISGGADKAEETGSAIRKPKLRADGTADDGFASDDEVSLTEEEREAKAMRIAAAEAAAKQAAAKALAEPVE
jgi:hypothetical protein